MSLRKAVLRGTRTLGIGHVTAQALMLVRNIIVAQGLSQSDMGIGIALMTSLALVEMMSSVRADEFIVHANDGDDPALQGSVQIMETARGLVTSMVLFLLASPLAFWFGQPDAIWAFRVVAVLPLVRGLGHLDAKRFQRRLDYRPQIWILVVPQLVAALAAWPVTMWLGDYSVILALMVLRVSVGLVTTHVVASRSYKWNFDFGHFRRIVTFGWPLLATGILLYAALNGDRFIVGSRYTHYSVAALGVYALSKNTTGMVRELVGATASQIIFPVLTRVRDDHARFLALYSGSCQALAIVGACCCIPFFLLGGQVMGLVYGVQYRNAADFIGWLAAAQAISMIGHAPVRASLAAGDTKNPLISGCVRTSFLVMMIVIAKLELSLTWLAAAGCAAELAALAASSLRLRHKVGIRAMTCLLPATFTLAWMLLGWGLSVAIRDWGPTPTTGACLGALMAVAITGLILFPSVRREAALLFE